MISLDINHLKKLGMGDFESDELSTVQQIYSQIDLDSDLFVSEYAAIGSLMVAHKDIEEASDRAYLTSLANNLKTIVDQMKVIERTHAPKKDFVLKRIFLSLTGPYELENKIQAQKATSNFEDALTQAKQDAARVKSRINKIDSMLKGHQQEVQIIRCHIAAGRLYLEHNLEAGLPSDVDITFTNIRERFARRLVNLSALLASHEMSFVQLKLTKAQSIDLCDRFTEVSEVLLPIWAHYQNTLKSGDKNDPGALASANKVHEALVLSLTKSVSSLNQPHQRTDR